MIPNNRKNKRANPEEAGHRSTGDFDLMLLRMLLRVIFRSSAADMNRPQIENAIVRRDASAGRRARPRGFHVGAIPGGGMAGKKGRSGRRSNAEIEQCRLLIARALSETDWQRIFAELAERAKNGSVAHMKVLFAYAFGIPTETNNPATTQTFVKLVEVIRAAQKDASAPSGEQHTKGEKQREEPPGK